MTEIAETKIIAQLIYWGKKKIFVFGKQSAYFNFSIVKHCALRSSFVINKEVQKINYIFHQFAVDVFWIWFFFLVCHAAKVRSTY